MPGIVVKPSESFEEAYRKFKKQTDRNLIVTETRAREFYETGTEKRKIPKNNKKTLLLKISRPNLFLKTKKKKHPIQKILYKRIN